MRLKACAAPSTGYGLGAGFSVQERNDFQVDAAKTLDLQLAIAPLTSVENIQEDTNKVNTESSSNGDALVLREKELNALSDDPDELRQQLLAMAGPSRGPTAGRFSSTGSPGATCRRSLRSGKCGSTPILSRRNSTAPALAASKFSRSRERITSAARRSCSTTKRR